MKGTKKLIPAFFGGIALLACILASNATAQQGCVKTPNGLVSWWPGDENANDIVDGNPGTPLDGATLAPGMVGLAFSFDGIDDSVDVPHNANLNPGSNDFTVDFWMKTTSPDTDLQAVINKRPECAHCSFWGIRLQNGHLTIELDEDAAETNYNVFFSTVPVNDGAWHHVALVRQGATATLYIDGLVAGSGTTLGITAIVNEADLFFGTDPCVGADGTQVFSGLLDEVQYLNVALEQREIQAIFSAGSAGMCDKETVCHKPGTPAQKTLSIPLQALAGHLGHGDATEPCQ